MNIKQELFCRQEERIPLTLEKILFVDPGLGGTGWAFFPRLITFGSKKPCLPSKTGVIAFPTSKYKEGWVKHVELIASSFCGICSAVLPKYIVIEQPTLWAGNAVSHAASVGKNGDPGDLFKLTYLVGYLGCIVMNSINKSPVLILPQEWKGQLPKEIVLGRLAEYGLHPKDHEGDAIGMGIAAQGKL